MRSWVGTYRSWMHDPRDVSSKERIFQGMHHTRDASSKVTHRHRTSVRGHIGRGHIVIASLMPWTIYSREPSTHTDELVLIFCIWCTLHINATVNYLSKLFLRNRVGLEKKTKQMETFSVYGRQSKTVQANQELDWQIFMRNDVAAKTNLHPCVNSK